MPVDASVRKVTVEYVIAIVLVGVSLLEVDGNFLDLGAEPHRSHLEGRERIGKLTLPDNLKADLLEEDPKERVPVGRVGLERTNRALDVSLGDSGNPVLVVLGTILPNGVKQLHIVHVDSGHGFTSLIGDELVEVFLCDDLGVTGLFLDDVTNVDDPDPVGDDGERLGSVIEPPLKLVLVALEIGDLTMELVKLLAARAVKLLEVRLDDFLGLLLGHVLGLLLGDLFLLLLVHTCLLSILDKVEQLAKWRHLSRVIHDLPPKSLPPMALTYHRRQWGNSCPVNGFQVSRIGFSENLAQTSAVPICARVKN